MSAVRARRCACALLLAAPAALGAQQEMPADRARVAEAVRADLAKLTDLERAYFAVNKRFTADAKALRFVPASGATVAVSYASARTFSASASHVRLAPYLCFVIASSVDSNSPAEKPFCMDSRYGTAATALARASIDTEPDLPVLPVRPSASAASGGRSVTSVTREAPARPESSGVDHTAATVTLTPAEFAARVRGAIARPGDSTVVVVHFAVKDARYDPTRGILEVAIERVPMPLGASEGPGGAGRPVIACYARPAFVCGAAGLTYIARDLFLVPRSLAPDPAVLRSGMTLDARFAIGRRDDTPGASLTLVALVLQAKGQVVSRWEPSAAP